MMRIRTLKMAIAAMLLAGAAHSDENAAGGQAEPRNHLRKATREGARPTVDEARAFLADAESRLFDLGVKASRAEWVQENFITEDTQYIAANASEQVNTLSADLAKKAKRFDGLQLPAEMARKMTLLKLAAGFPAPNDPAAQKELALVEASLNGDYGKGKWCPDGAEGKCLDVTAVGKLMATNRDPDELKRAWIGWHAVGAPMRQRYARMVELGNKGSQELGFADAGALWRSNYDMPPDGIGKGGGPALGATAASVSFTARIRAWSAREKVWK